MLRRTRAALAFWEEAAGRALALENSKCPWQSKQADALDRNAKRKGVVDSLGLLGSSRAPCDQPSNATTLALLRFLAVPGSMGSAQVLRPQRTRTGKLRTQRKLFPNSSNVEIHTLSGLCRIPTCIATTSRRKGESQHGKGVWQ